MTPPLPDRSSTFFQPTSASVACSGVSAGTPAPAATGAVCRRSPQSVGIGCRSCVFVSVVPISGRANSAFNVHTKDAHNTGLLERAIRAQVLRVGLGYPNPNPSALSSHLSAACMSKILQRHKSTAHHNCRNRPVCAID